MGVCAAHLLLLMFTYQYYWPPQIDIMIYCQDNNYQYIKGKKILHFHTLKTIAKIYVLLKFAIFLQSYIHWILSKELM